MDGKSSHCDDAALLERWCETRSESAFAELVHKYERLVVGAGLRRTGDLEAARDVAQQVFAMVASKARFLAGHSNIAGWLYRAASHVAARMRLSDQRRSTRHLAAAEQTDAGHEQDWPAFEEGLAELSAPEREALVLHFFQDLSYPEMAVALRINEATARKRVSRGVQSLGARLRRRGLPSGKTLLVGAA